VALGYESGVDIAVSRLPLSSIGFILSAVLLIKKNLMLKLALSNALRFILQVSTRILSLCQQLLAMSYKSAYSPFWRVYAKNPYMDAAVSQLQTNDAELKLEDLARLSPLGYRHINMLGRYSFALPEAIGRGELRSLREPATKLAFE